jgi:ribonuclease BN (tRNA processing enzyme)
VTIRLVTVGTGTVTPSATRASAAHWVEVEGPTLSGSPPPAASRQLPAVRLLLDCGAGTVHGLARHGLPWQQITHVAISHFHADHLGELPALLFAMKYGAMEPRSAPLTLIGPAGLRARLDGFAAALGSWVTEPGFSLEVVEIAPESGWQLPAASEQSTAGRQLPAAIQLVTGVTLTACKTPHTDESLGYAVATGEGRLVYTGDTGPGDALGDWARGCDLLLAECSLPDARAMAIHLTPGGAARLAERAEAKRLVLTHLYPPVEAEDILGIVGRTYRGPTIVARDGDRFEIR